MKKQRADLLLVAAGLAESRAKAQALIMAGLVYAGTARVQKSGDTLPEGAELSVKGQDHPWVSRGGVKLAHGLAHFGLSPAQKICLDIGASTGGFTDVLLTRGAEKVFAVDAGHDQLAWKLRSDERVIVMEKTNARYLNADLIPEQVQVVVCDASFIGLQTVLPAGLALCAANAFAIALIKPQFEAGPAQLSKGGVVRDPAVHQEVCARITAWWQGLPGWTVLGITPSPITGPAGNVEFLIAAQKT
jgi:23S rRNA (cytidine1920-2'-O)/16S rRNA (cytidine1409-2'-O)-methyltransferase